MTSTGMEHRLQHLDLVGALTVDHAASSFGLPVLVINGVAYGPGDTIDGLPVAIWPPEITGPTAGADISADALDPATHAAREAGRTATKAWNDRVSISYRRA